MFEIYDLVRVECPQGSHMANILVVLEKCPLSGTDADWRAGLETTNHQRHLPENNRTKRIDLSLITQFWPELQGYSSIITLAERQ
jgi:hypothetical protein